MPLDSIKECYYLLNQAMWFLSTPASSLLIEINMPVLEILAVRLKKGVSAEDPSLLENLSTVRDFVKTNSKFYHCIEDPSVIYIVGQWPSLAAHKEWLISPKRYEVLKAQEDQLEFVWMIHMDGTIGELPLRAPVLSIARLFVKNEHEGEFHRVAMAYREGLVVYTKPYRVVDGWRIDPEDGKKEFVVITGWETVEAHKECTRKMGEESKEYASLGEHFEASDVGHSRNMETW